MGDVVRALQGEVLDVPRVTGSAVSEMWADVAGDLTTSLDRFTLADLARSQASRDRTAAAMYSI
jgi:DNA-binding IscR family transcriptional regulator